MSKKNKLLVFSTLTTIVLSLTFFILYRLFSEPFIDSVFQGNSWDLFNQIILNHRLKDPDIRDLEFYTNKLQPFLARALFLTAITPQLIILVYCYRDRLIKKIKNFFDTPTHPINLAIVRIVIFAIFLNPFEGVGILDYVKPFTEIPSELIVLPLGFGWIFDYIPINITLVHISYYILQVACFLGIIGLFSNAAAFLALISGFYLMSIPQLFGKVTHSHPHLIWFMAILAVSQCADCLSVDSIFKSWKKADRGIVESPKPSRKYTIPIRFMWLLIGLIYFFPGLWKWLSAGFAWAFSDNLKYRLYENWHTGEWMPILRLDRYPLLYQPAAFGGIIFEIAFIFFLFSKNYRYIVAIGGLLFHNINNFLMRIPFWNLQYCYVVFGNWHYIFKLIGRILFQKKVYVLFNKNCRSSARAIAILKVLDILEVVTYVNVLDRKQVKENNLIGINLDEVSQDIYLLTGKKSWTGFFAYRKLVNFIPVLWLLIPFLYFPPFARICKRIHDRGDKNFYLIKLANLINKFNSYQAHLLRKSTAVIVVGSFLFVINSFYGLTGQSYAWPFACYPKFSGIAGPTRNTLEIVTVDRYGTELIFTESMQKSDIPTDRYLELLNNLLKQDESQNIRLKAFWTFLSRDNSQLQDINRIKFYKLTLLTSPEEQQKNPVNKQLILEAQV